MKFIKIALFFLAVIGSPALCFSQSNLTEYKKQFGDFLTKLGARESQIGRIGINEVKDSVGTLYFYASQTAPIYPSMKTMWRKHTQNFAPFFQKNMKDIKWLFIPKDTKSATIFL